jgi:SnoaL-like polyketide cyclase
MSHLKRQRAFPLLLSVALGLVACSRPSTPTSEAPGAAPESAAVKQLEAMKASETREQQNLATFDELDFDVYSHQKWDELPRSHASDIVVHWPDGRMTTGLEAHIADLKQQFVFAPDTKISLHPIKIAQDNWTAVQGVMEGTFSQPMPTPEGKSIPPTNKPFRLEMVTIGRWEDGVMKEEWLMWDNQSFMKQVGLAR